MDTMNSNTANGNSNAGGHQKSDLSSAATSLANDAVDLASRAASQTVSTVSREARDLLDKQVGRGASFLGNIGTSITAAAGELESASPQMAGLVRSMGERIDAYSSELEGQTVDGVIRSAGDLARRQPAVVFGVTALAGFLVMRAIKSTPAHPDKQLRSDGYDALRERDYGAR